MSEEKYSAISDQRWNQLRFLLEARWSDGPGDRFELSDPFHSIKLDPMEAARLIKALESYVQAKLRSAMDTRVEEGKVKFYVQRHDLTGWVDAGFKDEDPNETKLYDTTEDAKLDIMEYVSENNEWASKIAGMELMLLDDFRVAIWDGEEA